MIGLDVDICPGSRFFGNWGGGGGQELHNPNRDQVD